MSNLPELFQLVRLNFSKDANQARDVDGSHKGTHDPRARHA
jgi:hypothetical protein